MKYQHSPINSIVITGASSGLGEALALQYSQQRCTLGLIARDENKLNKVAARCVEKGATCRIGALDVTDKDAVAHWIRVFDAEYPVDLLVVNAGVFTGHGPNGQMETIDEIIWLLRTNLEGAVITMDAALPAMRKRRRGRIALICSLAAMQPLADAPGYSASKAGLLSYGEALREYLAPEGIAVSLICPGYIKTHQTEHHIGALPLMVSPEIAAAIIRTGIERDQTLIAFPRPLLFFLRLGRLANWRTRAFFGRRLRFHIEK